MASVSFCPNLNTSNSSHKSIKVRQKLVGKNLMTKIKVVILCFNYSNFFYWFDNRTIKSSLTEMFGLKAHSH